MDAGKIIQEIIVEDRQSSVTRKLHIHLNDTRAQFVRQAYGLDSILDGNGRIFAAIGADAMMADRNGPHVKLQKVFGSAVRLSRIAIVIASADRKVCRQAQGQSGRANDSEYVGF